MPNPMEPADTQTNIAKLNKSAIAPAFASVRFLKSPSRPLDSPGRLWANPISAIVAETRRR
jgi:hypothetical protein